jgi:hypothetical protein
MYLINTIDGSRDLNNIELEPITDKIKSENLNKKRSIKKFFLSSDMICNIHNMLWNKIPNINEDEKAYEEILTWSIITGGGLPLTINTKIFEFNVNVNKKIVKINMIQHGWLNLIYAMCVLLCL